MKRELIGAIEDPEFPDMPHLFDGTGRRPGLISHGTRALSRITKGSNYSTGGYVVPLEFLLSLASIDILQEIE